MKELSSLRLRVVALVYGLIVHNVQRAARLFSMRQSVGNLEPRVAVWHGSMLNLGHWATTELSSTVLSHPPCPTLSDHVDERWSRHWTQEFKQLKRSQRCPNYVRIMLPMHVAKSCKPLIYSIRGLCTPGRRRPYRFPRTYRIRS